MAREPIFFFAANFGIQDQGPFDSRNLGFPCLQSSTLRLQPSRSAMWRPWAGSGRRYQGFVMWLFKGIDFLSHISKGKQRTRWPLSFASKMLYTTNKCSFLFFGEWVWIKCTRSRTWNLWPGRALAIDDILIYTLITSYISYISFLLRKILYIYVNHIEFQG